MKKPRPKTEPIGTPAASKSASRPSSSSAVPPRKPPPILPSEWHEFLSSLIAHRVRFSLVGKLKNTADLDLFVEPTVSNARVCGATWAGLRLNFLGEAQFIARRRA